MNYRSMVLLFFIGIYVTTHAKQETITLAHEQYNAGEYAKAYDLYNEIEHKGAATWYNLGNCAFRLGRNNEALVCWQRAHQKAPLSLQKWCAYNSDCAREKLDMEKITPSNLSNIVDFFMNMIAIVPLIIWQLLVLGIWYICWFYGRAWYYHKKFLAIVLITVLLATTIGALAISYKRNRQHVCVGDTPVPLYAVPDVNFNIVGMVPAHTILAVEQQRGTWYKIQTPTMAGWLTQELVIDL